MSSSEELFRYARVRRPRVLDLTARLSHISEVRPFLSPSQKKKSASREKQRWARTYLKSKDAVTSVKELDLPLDELLDAKKVKENALPGPVSVRDRGKLAEFVARHGRVLDRARDRIALSLLSNIYLGNREAAQSLSRDLQLVERIPQLATATDEPDYAPVVLKRFSLTPAKLRAGEPSVAGLLDTAKATRPAVVERRTAILDAWELTNHYVTWRRREISRRVEAVKATQFNFDSPKLPRRKMGDKVRTTFVREARAKAFRDFIRSKKETLDTLREEREHLDNMSIGERIDAMSHDNDFTAYLARKYKTNPSDVAAAITEDVPKSGATGFCDAYEKAGRMTQDLDNTTGCIAEIDNPCVAELVKHDHRFSGADQARPLGVAELVTVEQTWLGYTPGEISGVRSVLKGEVHVRRTKTTKYFEDVSERMTREAQESESDTESTMNQELRSAVESEIATRFNSDVNASASGSGGGTFGVVNFEGSASLGANIGVGVDSNLSTSDESRFSQEIVSKAIERTKRATSELRRTKSTSHFETRERYRLDNSGTGSSNENAIYCYLDKHVCITERVYGLRTFLGAEIVRPGMDLLRHEMSRRAVDIAGLDAPPVFDISPADITPDNYLSLVGRFRATSVEPPPAAVKMVSKTYKADKTNENPAPEKPMVEKIADTLTPFFGEYRRFLIQDNIEIPEGYRVQEVKVTVTHGSNGVSIPAHLPFSLLGAAIYALPTLGVAAIPPYTFYYLPMAIWQVLYTASPLLHYNADSSNVTVNIGHQTEESPYFFLQPDLIIREVLDALGSSSMIGEEFLSFIRERLEQLYAAIYSEDGSSPLLDSLVNVSGQALDQINTFIAALSTWLGKLLTDYIPRMFDADPDNDVDAADLEPIPALNPDVIAQIPAALLQPFQAFFDSLINYIENVMQNALGDLFDYFGRVGDNTDMYTFSGMRGFRALLPVSFNCIALKPGVTINLTACLVRIEEEALDAWRLATFERLSQAYYQLEADYASRLRQLGTGMQLTANPAVMRMEERTVLKNRVIRALRALPPGGHPDQPPTLDELQLFEHAIDWENVTYRTYHYGPQGAQLAWEKLGFYRIADRERRRFLESSWAQVLIPLREDVRLEQVFMNYLRGGGVNFHTDLLAELEGSDEERLDEITAIYRDLVLNRQALPTRQPKHRRETLPTEYVVIYEPTPEAAFPVHDIQCPEEDCTDNGQDD